MPNKQLAHELEPCPFCGGAARSWVPEPGYGLPFAACTRCTCEGPKKQTEAEAIAAWNTRALRTDDRTTEPVQTDEVREVLAEIAGAYDKWNPDASFCSSALYAVSKKAKALIERLSLPTEPTEDLVTAAEHVAAVNEAHKTGWRLAMEAARASGPSELIERLQTLKRMSASIYGPLIDQTCAALRPTEPSEDVVERAEAWLRQCSDWLLSTDLDMTCPMETDPLDLADELAALSTITPDRTTEPSKDMVEYPSIDGLARVLLDKFGDQCGFRELDHWFVIASAAHSYMVERINALRTTTPDRDSIRADEGVEYERGFGPGDGDSRILKAPSKETK